MVKQLWNSMYVKRKQEQQPECHGEDAICPCVIGKGDGLPIFHPAVLSFCCATLALAEYEFDTGAQEIDHTLVP